MYEILDDDYWVMPNIGIYYTIEKVFEHMRNKRLISVDVCDYDTGEYYTIVLNLLSGAGEGTDFATFEIEIIGEGALHAGLQIDETEKREHGNALTGHWYH